MSERTSLQFPDLLPIVAAVVPVVAVYNALGISHILALTAAAVVIITLYRRRPIAVPNLRVFGLLAALVAWAGLSSVWALDSDLSLVRFAKLAAISVSLCFIVVATMAITPKQQYRLAMTLAIAWLVAATLLVLEVYLDGALFLQKVFGPWLHDTKALKALTRGGAVLVILSWIVAPALIRMRIGIAAAAILLTPGFFLVKIGAGSATLAWGVGLAVGAIGWLLPRKPLVIIACAAPVLVLAMPLVTARIPSDLSHLSGNIASSALHRLATWRFTTDRIAERPIVGWGLENSRLLPGGNDIVPIIEWIEKNPEAARKHPNLPGFLKDSPPEYLPLHPHSIVLQTWVELGLVGGLLGAALVVAIVLLLFRDQVTRLDRAATLALLASGGTIACLSYGAWQSWWLSTLALVATFVVALHGMAEEPKPAHVK